MLLHLMLVLHKYDALISIFNVFPFNISQYSDNFMKSQFYTYYKYCHIAYTN